MDTLNNEKGVALVTALMLSLVMLAFCMTLMYVITQSTKSSASHKRYSTSVAAGYGGTEMVKAIIPTLMPYSTSITLKNHLPIATFSDVNLAFSSTAADIDCLSQKLNKPTQSWSYCSSANKIPDARIKPDFTFTLKGPTATAGQGYKVYTKIVNTVAGNSDSSGVENLEAALAVTQNGGGATAPTHLPSVFTIEVTGEKEFNPTERSELSVLYVY